MMNAKTHLMANLLIQQAVIYNKMICACAENDPMTESEQESGGNEIVRYVFVGGRLC